MGNARERNFESQNFIKKFSFLIFSFSPFLSEKINLISFPQKIDTLNVVWQIQMEQHQQKIQKSS